MAPAHVERAIRPALNTCTKHSLASSRIAASRHWMLSARNPHNLGQSTRYMCWWGKKRNGWLYTAFDHRFRKYLRRRGIDPRSIELSAGGEQRGAEGHRSFSRAKDERIRDGSESGRDPVDPFFRQQEMIRQRMEDWKKLLERDPYEALFGKSNALLKGRRWHPFWDEYAKGKKWSGVQDQSKETTPSSISKAEPSQPLFTYDPISGRMVMRDATGNTEAVAKSALQNGAVDISTEPSRDSSDPASPRPEEVDPLDSLHSALGEYEAKHGLKSPKVETESCTDPVREALGEYESRIKEQVPKAAGPEADRLRECLREYDSQPERPSRPDAVPEADKGDVESRNWKYGDSHPVPKMDDEEIAYMNWKYQDLRPVRKMEDAKLLHPVKSKLPEDDIDMLQASDIRANMGIMRHPQRQTSKEKEEQRARLEKEFDGADKSNESEVVSKPSIPKKPALETNKATPPSKRWISTEIEELIPPHQASWKKQVLSNAPEPKPQKLQTSLQSRELQPIQTSLDRLRYSYREIKKDLAAQKEQQNVEIEQEDNTTLSAKPIPNREKAVASEETQQEEGSKELYETHYDESQQPLPKNDLEGRVDTELHNRLKDYEGNETSSVYRYSSVDDLDFETASHQGSTSSAKQGQSAPQTSGPESERLPSLESLLSSSPESILISYGDKPKKLKIATHSLDVSSGLSSEPPAQALSKFVRPDLFFPYLNLLDKYDIVKSADSLLVLRNRAPTVPEAILEHTQESPAAAAKQSKPEPRIQETIPRLPINPIDGTTIPLPEPPIGNFASPTGFVSYSPPPPTASQSSQDPSDEETSSSDKDSQRPKSRGGGAASVAKTAIWAGAACYIAGVAGELMK
jgi:hypothetical protein